MKKYTTKYGTWHSAAAAAAKSLQSCPTLCDPIDGSPPGSPIPGILQARLPGLGCHFLLQCMKVESEVVQSCPTLSDPTDCSLPGSSVHGILQERVLEWGAIAFSWHSEDLQMGQLMEFWIEKESFPYRLNFQQVEWWDIFPSFLSQIPKCITKNSSPS